MAWAVEQQNEGAKEAFVSLSGSKGQSVGAWFECRLDRHGLSLASLTFCSALTGWLARHGAVIDCRKRRVRFQTTDYVPCELQSRRPGDRVPRVSALQARHLFERGCMGGDSRVSCGCHYGGFSHSDCIWVSGCVSGGATWVTAEARCSSSGLK